jgi:hypothetical protein
MAQRIMLSKGRLWLHGRICGLRLDGRPPFDWLAVHSLTQVNLSIQILAALFYISFERMSFKITIFHKKLHISYLLKIKVQRMRLYIYHQR